MRHLNLAGLSLVILALALIPSRAQQPWLSASDDLARGIQLYKDGDFGDATIALQAVLNSQKENILLSLR